MIDVIKLNQIPIEENTEMNTVKLAHKRLMILELFQGK